MIQVEGNDVVEASLLLLPVDIYWLLKKHLDKIIEDWKNNYKIYNK
jgi:hypothetical protein